MSAIMNFWQMHAPIFSILIPGFTAFILILLGNCNSDTSMADVKQFCRRILSLISGFAGLATAISYLSIAYTGKITVYQLGEWSAPFGIILVLDQLSAFMLLLTYVLAVPILWFASKEWDQRGRYFHTMFHFLLMGICGAFLTGDLFNLFVFFEILLMASYVLLLHSQGKARFQLGIHYVTINLLASSIFLIGLGMIYGSVGSLNMVDVSRLLPTLEPDQHKLALAGGLLLFIVFSIKAAILPVGFWLPKTYAVAITPVAAIFTIMTKVGIYAILRVNGTIFNDPFTQTFFNYGLLILGLITSLYGVIGAIAADRLRRFVGFMILSSIGTIFIALSLLNTKAWAAALYYLVHSTFIAAVFYVLCGWITSQRGSFKDHLKISPKMKQDKLVGCIYFVIALMIAGLPPFSGFLGKIFILQAAFESPYQIEIMIIILLVSFFSIIALTRVGFILFWKATPPPEESQEEEAYIEYQNLPYHAPSRNDLTIYTLLLILIAYIFLTPSIYHYAQTTAVQLKNYALYKQLILKSDQFGESISVLPYDSTYIPQTKYAGEVADPNAHYIPKIISKDTLMGEHLSEYKNQQIEEQQNDEKRFPSQFQLKPMEP